LSGRVALEPDRFTFDSAESDLTSATGTYSSTETVRSAYGMARLAFGQWTWLGGVRVEATRFTARGNQLSQSSNGRPTGIVAATTAGEYAQFLPGLHLRYESRANLLVRSSVTRTLVRPNYRDLSPRQTINDIDRRIASGNPELRPYEATNFDISADWYLDRVGLLSVAPFYKEIAHYIVEAKRSVILGERGVFNETRPANGDTARVWGIEAAWQSRPFEAAVIDGNLGLDLNYTFLHGSARLPGRPDEVSSLPDQPQHQVNVTLHATRRALSVDLSVRYRTELLEEIVRPGRDIYDDGGFETELNLAWKLTKSVKLTASAANLLRRPDHVYSGDRQHQKEFEAAIVSFNVGVQWRR
jgi:TonB-dependent receptor